MSEKKKEPLPTAADRTRTGLYNRGASRDPVDCAPWTDYPMGSYEYVAVLDGFYSTCDSNEHSDRPIVRRWGAESQRAGVERPGPFNLTVSQDVEVWLEGFDAASAEEEEV